MGRFIKNIEDFTCEVCGFFVEGTGYTNHCPHCFHSKHVDINPGDRACSCKGLMKPIAVSGSIQDLHITHKCTSCGFERANKVQEIDNMDQLATLVETINSQR